MCAKTLHHLWTTPRSQCHPQIRTDTQTHKTFHKVWCSNAILHVCRPCASFMLWFILVIVSAAINSRMCVCVFVSLFARNELCIPFSELVDSYTCQRASKPISRSSWSSPRPLRPAWGRWRRAGWWALWKEMPCSRLWVTLSRGT